jgi:hypothetical protein
LRFHSRRAAEIPARKANLAHRGRLALKVRRASKASRVRKDRRVLKVLQEKKEKRAIMATRVTGVMRRLSDLVPSKATDL